MSKVITTPTTPKQIGDIMINVPVGSLDRPTTEMDAKVVVMQDATNWKMPTKRIVVATRSEADDIVYALTWYMGGAEIREVAGGFEVGSLGYYHYIGS